jgi:hypothetical protein
MKALRLEQWQTEPVPPGPLVAGELERATVWGHRLAGASARARTRDPA